jgi:hypothetical protein
MIFIKYCEILKLSTIKIKYTIIKNNYIPHRNKIIGRLSTDR